MYCVDMRPLRIGVALFALLLAGCSVSIGSSDELNVDKGRREIERFDPDAATTCARA